MKAKMNTYLVELCWSDGTPILGAHVLIYASKCEMRYCGPDSRYPYNFMLMYHGEPVFYGTFGLEVSRLALWNESTESFEDILTLEDVAG